MPKFDILVAGEINPDLIMAGDVTPEFGQTEKLVSSAALTIGSSSAIFACGAARLGLRVAFIGVCGEDVFGGFMLEEMQKREVDVSNVLIRAGEQTGLTVHLNRGPDRAILTHPGLIPALRSTDVSEALLGQARHLHVASYFLQTALQPGLPELFQRARNLGLTTSLDPNYDPSGQWAGFKALLPVVDVFFPNEREALAVTGEAAVERAAEALAHMAGTVAVKMGPEGGLALRAGRLVRAAALSVQFVDAVGAGDSFDAGFLYGYLHNWDLERCLRMACVCGALSTRGAGGTDAQPTLEEAMRYVPE